MSKRNIEPDFTVPEVARILRVAQIKVRRWIRAGDLAATNTSNSSSRSIYTIPREALEEFRRKRSGAVADDSLPRVKNFV